MSHYDFTQQFRAVYDEAVKRYEAGDHDLAGWFSADDRVWLAANGLTPQHLFDYAEDHVDGGEPGYDRALAIELVRRDYFLNAQGGRPSKRVLDEASLPAKADEVRGIAWLPRLIPKAKAKLRGELPPSLMYCCGGDRAFFRRHDIQPAEFLSLVWRHEQDDGAIVDWVARRSRSS